MSIKPNGLERFSLEGRVVLITGGRRGLGLEMARGMAAAGARVGINGRDARTVEAAAAGIPNAFAAPFDVTDVAAASAAIDALVARHGRLDCLVNNAAVRDRRAFRDIAGGDLRRLLEINLVAAYEVSRLAARHMEQGDPAYTSSKGALSALMRALAVELGPKGITANAIAPGFFLTDVNAAFFESPVAAELGRRIPLRRWGRPEELVGAAIVHASDAASYVNGHVLTVDAGLSVAL
jgi:gluconate 5-dehydrogenase